jgi:hypothetical protein
MAPVAPVVAVAVMVTVSPPVVPTATPVSVATVPTVTLPHGGDRLLGRLTVGG